MSRTPREHSARYIAAIDQGTTSTRCILFDTHGQIAAASQQEHQQFFPQPGWVEHDPAELLQRTRAVIRDAAHQVSAGPGDIAALGITNQRETTVVWDRATGAAIHPAIVWQDTRTDALCRQLGDLGGGVDRYRERTGLPLASYFAGPKIAWILDHVPGARARAEAGELAAGTMDSFLVWHLTGGARHITDATNASRTLLMDLHSVEWDAAIAAEMQVPLAVLPEIVPSCGVVGTIAAGGMTLPAAFADVPIAGILGDQQAALFGQACFSRGDAKNTYGTGNFLLVHTGDTPVQSQHGLISTVASHTAGEPVQYALEGSIAVTGSLVQWLRDNLGFFTEAADIEELAASVPDTGGAYVVPAFSGLFAPYWRPDARGAIVGLTRYVTKAHLARAALEATAYQTRDVLDAVRADLAAAGTRRADAAAADLFAALKVDGGMVLNGLLLQIQADVLGATVVRPRITETTALGAAYAAGLAVGVWANRDEIRQLWQEDRRWDAVIPDDQREAGYARWRKAVTRSFDWA